MHCGKEYKDTFSLYQCDISHNKVLTMDIDTDYPPIEQKPYTLPLIDTEWVCDDLECFPILAPLLSYQGKLTWGDIPEMIVHWLSCIT